MNDQFQSVVDEAVVDILNIPSNMPDEDRAEEIEMAILAAFIRMQGIKPRRAPRKRPNVEGNPRRERG